MKSMLKQMSGRRFKYENRHFQRANRRLQYEIVRIKIFRIKRTSSALASQSAKFIIFNAKFLVFNTKLLVFNTKFIIFTPLISVLSRPHHLVKSSFLIKSHHFSYRQFIVFHRKFIIFIMQNTSLTARQLRDHACGTCERQTFNYNDNIRIHIETSQNRPKKQ